MTVVSTQLKPESIPTQASINEEFVKLQHHEALIGSNPFYRDSVVRERYAYDNHSNIEEYLKGEKFKQSYLKRFLDLKSFYPHNGLDKKFIRKLGGASNISFSLVLMETILTLEATTAFARHELNAVRFAGRKKFDSHFDIIWASLTPSLAKEIAEVALLGILELLPEAYQQSMINADFNYPTKIEALLRRVGRRKMAPSTAVVKLAANERGIPCELVGTQHLILGQGVKQQYLYASTTSTTPITAQKICADKRQTNRRLKELRLAVPVHVKVSTVEAAKRAAADIGMPVIIKPVKGQKGRAISDKLRSIDDIQPAFDSAHRSGADVLVEKYCEGDDYRLLVIDGKFHSALLRKPPTITGDGVSTIEELIEQLNSDPYRDGFRGYPVLVDDEVKARLSRESLGLQDILEQGKEIQLRLRANISTGGTPKDVTTLVHPEVRAMAERAARAVKLTVAGIDYLTTEIDRSPAETGGVIIEINARPGLDIHVWPHSGKSRDVGGELLKHLFPAADNGRVPVITSSGDRGTGVPARLVDALLRGVGKRVALTLKEQAFADGVKTELSNKQQLTAPLVMLRDPEIDALVGTISLRQTAKRGMLLDRSDVSIILDRAKTGSVKAFLAGMEVVIQATSRCFVVSAGNLVALKRIEKLSKSKQLIVVSPRKNDSSLKAHLDDGHIAVTTSWEDNDQCIVILSADKTIASFTLEGLSGKFTGRSKVISEGILYAVGAVYGAGIEPEHIANSMKMLQELVTVPSG